MSSFICWQHQRGVGPGGFDVWKSSEGRISRVTGYVFLSPKGEGDGAAVYDSFDLEAFA